MIGFFYFGTQYLQGVLGFSAFEAGVVDAGAWTGVMSEDLAELKRLKRENAELKRTNAIMITAL